MPPKQRPLLWSARFVATLGILSLSFTGELSHGYLLFGWATLFLGVLSDLRPLHQEKLRTFETQAVILLVGNFLFDFFYRGETVFVAVAHFLMVFQAFKFLGLKERKDCLQMVLFGFFQILGACTLSVDVWHAMVLLLLIPSAGAALFWNESERQNEAHQTSLSVDSQKRYRRMALGVAWGALPVVLGLTAGVFLAFPRLTLNATVPGFGNSRIGYTDQVNLSQTGRLRDQGNPVLWLSFPVPGHRERWDGYLRGTTLDIFDGRQWTPDRQGKTRTLLPGPNNLYLVNPAIGPVDMRQSITLVNTSAATLFVSGLPREVIAPLPSLVKSASAGLTWTAPWRRPLRYEVFSSVADFRQAPTTEFARDPQQNLRLPAVSYEKTAALARRAAGRGDALTRARALERFLQTEYRYSLDLGDTIADNPVEDFLFNRKSGPCGHFSSALAVMLRLQRIPSRLVAGYLRGEWNGPAGHYLIREKHAHAWVEAYIEGRGWIRLDASPRLLTATPMERQWQSVKQYWDYLGFKWNRLVIQYDLYAQLRAFERLRSSSNRVNDGLSAWWNKSRPRSRGAEPLQDESSLDTQPFIFQGILLALAGFASFLLIRRRSGHWQEPPEVRDYRRFLHVMEKSGAVKQPSETGWEFAQRLEREQPANKKVVWDATRRYYDSRFTHSSAR